VTETFALACKALLAVSLTVSNCTPAVLKATWKEVCFPLIGSGEGIVGWKSSLNVGARESGVYLYIHRHVAEVVGHCDGEVLLSARDRILSQATEAENLGCRRHGNVGGGA